MLVKLAKSANGFGSEVALGICYCFAADRPILSRGCKGHQKLGGFKGKSQGQLSSIGMVVVFSRNEFVYWQTRDFHCFSNYFHCQWFDANIWCDRSNKGNFNGVNCELATTQSLEFVGKPRFVVPSQRWTTQCPAKGKMALNRQQHQEGPKQEGPVPTKG